MKIAFKIVAVCLVAMILVTALSSWLIARREFRRVRDFQQSDAQRVGDMIRESVDLAYQKGGSQGIIQAIRTQTVETGNLQYRWVWFDVSAKDPSRPAAPMDQLQRILNGEMDSVVSDLGGTSRLHTYYPLEVNDDSGNKRKGAVEITGSLESASQEAWQTIKTGLISIATMAVVCIAIVTWAGIWMIGRPLKQLTQQTRRIGRGEYNQPIEVPLKDEFGELALAMNQMGKQIAEQQSQIEQETAARLSTVEQLRHADRLKTVGRLAAGIAHEIGTPLNVVSGRAGLIRSGKLTVEEINESANAIQSEANRIAGIVRQLMDYARNRSPRRSRVDLRVLMDRTVTLLQTLADKNGVVIRSHHDCEEPCTANVDEAQLQQVFTNLIVNAIQSMPEGGQLDLRIENVKSTDPSVQQCDCVRVSIRDQGFGMDSETRDQIFEPFFTTKEPGQGTGLGLSIVLGIIEEHGGTIEVDSEPGNGTEFRVMLPRNRT